MVAFLLAKLFSDLDNRDRDFVLDEQKSEIRLIHIVAAVLLCSSSKFITLGFFYVEKWKVK